MFDCLLQEDIIDTECVLTVNNADSACRNVIVHGRSLGGAIAIYLATKREDKMRALILENTFTCIAGAALHLFMRNKYNSSSKRLERVLNYLITSPWPSEKIIGQLRLPMFFVSGKLD